MLQNGIYSAEIAMLLITYMDNIIDDVFHRIIEHDFEISEFTANMKRVSEILDDKGEIEKFGDKEYKNVKGKIDIENLEFKYKDTDDKVLKNILNLDEQLRNGKLNVLNDWLDINVRQYGCCYTAGEMAEKATGKRLDAVPYLDYLNEKYRNIYQI